LKNEFRTHQLGYHIDQFEDELLKWTEKKVSGGLVCFSKEQGRTEVLQKREAKRKGVAILA